MRVTSVEVHPAGSSDVAVLSFRDPRRNNPYNVRSITGLDADDIVSRYYGVSGVSKLYNLALEKREISISVELNPDYGSNGSYSGLRDMLYKMIASSRTGVIQLQFKDGTDVIAAISGFVSKFEASHFSKMQEVQITLQCVDPMLRALARVNVDVAAASPSLTIVDDDVSTAPHGAIFVMGFVSASAAFTVGDDDWSFTVTPSGGFLTGDILHISSEHNNKYVYVHRGVDDIYLADKVSSGAIWPILFPGENTFICTNPSTLDWTSISHYPTYWGV